VPSYHLNEFSFMKISLSLIALMLSIHSFSQTGTGIKYKMESMSDSYASQYSRFVYNDSFAFYYFFTNGSDPLKKKMVFSKNMLHHSLFCDKMAKVTYNEVDYPAGNTFLIKDTLQSDVWQFGGGSRQRAIRS
jgi:hypothetical protein